MVFLGTCAFHYEPKVCEDHTGKIGEEREGHISLIKLALLNLLEKLFDECKGSCKGRGCL